MPKKPTVADFTVLNDDDLTRVVQDTYPCSAIALSYARRVQLATLSLALDHPRPRDKFDQRLLHSRIAYAVAVAVPSRELVVTGHARGDDFTGTELGELIRVDIMHATLTALRRSR